MKCPWNKRHELGTITVKNAGGKGLDYKWYHNHTMGV
jgi:hypothetical protein